MAVAPLSDARHGALHLRLLSLTELATASLVVAVVVIVPLVFDPNLDDAFAFPKVTAIRVIGLLGAVTFLCYVLLGGSIAQNGDRWIDLPLGVFAALVVAASVASIDAVQSFAGEPYQYQGLVTVLLYLGAFYVSRLALGSTQGFRRLLTAIVCTGSAVSIYGIAQSLGVDPFWSGPPDDDRIISSVGQSNDLATYLVVVVIAAIGLWPTAGGRARVGLGAVILISVFALALTFSRGGYVGLAAALGVVLLPRFRAAQWGRAAAPVVAVAAGVLVVALALPPGRAMVERIVNRAVTTIDLSESSARMHVDLWRIGSQIALDHPILGTGPETFPLVFRPYLEDLPPDRAQLLGGFRLESPHNELIGVAAEMGLPALAAYVIFLGACAWACVKRARAGEPASRSIALVVLATLVSHVLMNSFKTPDVTTSSIFWIVLGAGLAAMGARAESDVREPSGAGR